MRAIAYMLSRAKITEASIICLSYDIIYHHTTSVVQNNFKKYFNYNLHFQIVFILNYFEKVVQNTKHF